jgi:hypothetical protein
MTVIAGDCSRFNSEDRNDETIEMQSGVVHGAAVRLDFAGMVEAVEAGSA